MKNKDAIEQLIKDLRIKSGMINMCERIEWGSEAALMDKAADALEKALTERGLLGAVPDGWRGIESAPKDGTLIVGFCKHDADEYYLGNGRLTIYGAFCEMVNHAPDGIHIVEYGGGFDDRTYDEPTAGCMDDYWFVTGSELEMVANPTHWMPLPQPPKAVKDE